MGLVNNNRIHAIFYKFLRWCSERNNITLYKNIKEDLLNKIKHGHFSNGETIPSENELAQMYSVSRPTIRQALQILSDGLHR